MKGILLSFKIYMNKIWFKRKLYGWGWTPVTREGWLVVAVWIVIFYFSIINMDHEWLKNTIFIFLLTGVLLLICYKKGEKPRWQWGKKN